MCLRPIWLTLQVVVVLAALIAIAAGCVGQFDSHDRSSVVSHSNTLYQDDWLPITSDSVAEVTKLIVTSAVEQLQATPDGLASPSAFIRTCSPMVMAVLSGQFEPISTQMLDMGFEVNPEFPKTISSYRRYTSLSGVFPDGIESQSAGDVLAFFWNQPERRSMAISEVSVKSLTIGHAKSVDLNDDWNTSAGVAKFSDIWRQGKERFTNDEVSSLAESEVAFVELRVRFTAGYHSRLRFLFFYDNAAGVWAPAMLACEIPPGAARPVLLF